MAMAIMFKARILLVFMLAACTANPATAPTSLSENLEGKTEGQKKQFLYNECLKEASWQTQRGHHYISHEYEILCQQMRDNYGGEQK